ncbi:TOPRIM nucleotidyl transferase/hydrolase domain-containing protein [Pseudoalteromonas piscicida]|uniref:TOPRIM nucleotidyl transferase/hydrolase domain-containing protein n=1 Tax=Pseudoalteromonas piscicida TaxID=43662 RepID=UPI0032C15EDE
MSTENTRCEIDYSEIVKDTYLLLVKDALNSITYLNFDGLLNRVICLFISDPSEPDKKLLITDKFYIYKNIWKAVIELLYKEFLPNYNYRFEWEIEISPFTITLCELTKGKKCESEFDIIKSLLKISDEQFETDYYQLLNKLGADSLGFPDGIVGKIPKSLVPGTRIEQLNFLFRLMTFPPLDELAVFYMRYGSYTKQKIESLSVFLPGTDFSQIADFKLQGPLANSYFNLSHTTFQKYGLDNIESNEQFSMYKNEFKSIRESADLFKGQFKDKVICSCCGEDQEISLPEEVAQFKFLIESRKLSRDVGLLYIDDYIFDYKSKIAESLSKFTDEINAVEHPKCLILVEGESEEVLIPIIALRCGLSLSSSDVKVYNSKSKQKLESDFINFKAKYPKLKMVCVLDSDAIKERDSLNRLIKGNRNKYHLTYIEKGCFEDLFNLKDSIRVLNDLYPDGELILISDFDKEKDFLTNVKKILHFKKKAQFDKVKFAKKIAYSIEVTDIPEEMMQVLKAAEKFTTKKVFIES